MMKVSVIAILLVVFLENSFGSLSEELDYEWNMYKTEYQKSYNENEEYARRLIWEENVKRIKEHNALYIQGKYTHYLGVNQFADMTNEEFREKYLRLAPPKERKNSVSFMPPLNIGGIPKSVDWVKKGYVTPVKNQGPCGSCWAFSTTGSMEGQYRRKVGKLVSFSEQQLVDCSGSFGNMGCHGGWMDWAFNYIQRYGIEREQDYPYTAKEGICKYNKSKIVTKISGHKDIKKNDENALAIAVATQGPISVAVDARGFIFYHGGIYNNPNCSTTDLDHAVLVVGYGSLRGVEYWLVKNSWGTSWGEKGYIKMSKDKNNQCGIASRASFPIM